MSAVSSLLSSTAPQDNSYWAGWQQQGLPWQWAGPDDSADYWLEHTKDALNIMQDTYWNGTYWPSTIQWVGAVIDTIMISTQETYTSNLEADGSNDNPSTSSTDIESDIEKYYAQVESYYNSEDTIQIFDAAYDDAQWVVLEWLEAINFSNQHDAVADSGLGQDAIAKYAHRAHVFYDIVQDKFNTSECDGGITWNPTLATYKNAITNELFISSSIAMYLYFPGDNNTDPYPHPDYQPQTNSTLPPLSTMAMHDSTFLLNAVRAYDWFATHNFTNVQGLIVDGFHVTSNQTTCDERNEMVYTYNQAVILSGLRGLWEATSDTKYLSDGYDLIAIVINATGWNADSASAAAEWAGLGRNGILEDYCDAPATCAQDNYVFKGVYFQHLSQFCRPLPTETPLVEDFTHIAPPELADAHDAKCQSYASWIQHNAHAALSTRNETGIMGEWWGAAYVNRTQSRALDFAVPLPLGFVDVRNDPGLLETALWRCDGRGDCGGNGDRWWRQAEKQRRKRKRQVMDDVRTVETQAQGLSVVRAATDIRRQAQR
ncbi:unnamed protein product [Zymoseptoria tritici ST99CH_3D7]|uniref:Mannan endo-1,6-alpha-mannosidase n=1 Tax=Zymoseptoria tritici (strain ST99CH_3D7) TaxID=1276538 RepID=A0A1X7RWC5_ZYMT9|nr:unnamed protein product [Zymoseptoria tritici ST99CH_3D7]